MKSAHKNDEQQISAWNINVQLIYAQDEDFLTKNKIEWILMNYWAKKLDQINSNRNIQLLGPKDYEQEYED